MGKIHGVLVGLEKVHLEKIVILLQILEFIYENGQTSDFMLTP